MIIRKATIEDMPQLIWSADLEEFRELTQSKFTKDPDTKIYLVAVIDNEIVGQIVADFGATYKLPCLYALRVKDKFQNQGIGTKLIIAVEEKLKEKGFKKLYIEVEIHNDSAKKLYERLGYTVVRQRLDSFTYTHNGVQKVFSEEVCDLEKEL